MLKLTFAAVLLGACAGGVVWLSRLESLRISSIEVNGAVTAETESIEALVNGQLAGSYAYLFPRANAYIYPRKNIVQALEVAFPEVRTVDVRVKDKVLAVDVVERKPKYIWCKGEPKDADALGCYFMDDDGFIFEEAPRFSGIVFETYYGGVKDENPIGRIFLTQDQFANLAAVYQALTDRGVEVISCFARENGVRECALLHGGKVLFKSSQQTSALIGSLGLIADQTSLLSKKSTTTLDYLDLRFGNKIYYKFVGDNSVQTDQ